MRRFSPHEIDIIDAEFRVISRSRWAGWMAQLPNSRDRFAFVCVAAAPLALLGGLLLGFMQLAFLAAALLATVGCLFSTEWKRYGVAGLVVIALLFSSGCSQDAAPEGLDAPKRATLANEKIKTPEEVQASIREATRYRDPRADLKPKGIDILNGEVKEQEGKEAKEASDEAR